MKRLFLVFALLLLLCSPSSAATKSELKRMSVFISNFTELDLYNFDSSSISMGELIYFGIYHNYINNSSLIKHIENNDNYDSSISAKNVAASVRKYFDKSVTHKDAEYNYKDGKYYFYATDGVPTEAKVREFSREGKVITMKGELYRYNAEEDKDEVVGEFTATAKPHKWNGKDTWAILSLKSKLYEEKL
mgnify:CR=1 FL=1